MSDEKKEAWKLVPVEPTPDMIQEGINNNPISWNDGTDGEFMGSVANDVYRAMVAASPSPAQEPVAFMAKECVDFLMEKRENHIGHLAVLSTTPKDSYVPIYAHPSPSPSLTKAREALRDIAAERERQIDVEGWTPEHDDKHVKGELANAAACYAATRTKRRLEFPYERELHGTIVKKLWPFSIKWWKPGSTEDRRRDLVKAGALILAEIERLDRVALAALETTHG